MAVRHLQQLLTPSPLGIVIYCAATVVVLVGSIFSSLVSHFIDFSDVPEAPGLIHSYLHSGLVNSTAASIFGSASTFVLWTSFGALIYLVAWSLVSTYAAAHNDFVIGTTYTSIETHGHLLFWLEIVARLLMRVCAALLIVILTIIVVSLWYPVSVTILKSITSGGAPMSYWLYSLLSIVGWLLVWHLYVIFVRLALLRTRIIG
jgi:hypothetical protein